MTKPSARLDRRRPHRPSVGDWKHCPSCASGMLVFTEKYCGSSSSAVSNLSIPAWVCDQCPNVMFVRAEHRPPAVRQNAQTLRAEAKRSLMKSRFVRGRADRVLKKSRSRKPPGS